MGGVDIGRIKCSFYDMLLKVMSAKNCAADAEQKNDNVLKIIKLATKTNSKQTGKNIKHIANNPKIRRKPVHAHLSILAPRRSRDQNIDGHAPTQLRLARTHGTYDTHETKTKTKRSRHPGCRGEDKPYELP